MKRPWSIVVIEVLTLGFFAVFLTPLANFVPDRGIAQALCLLVGVFIGAFLIQTIYEK